MSSKSLKWELGLASALGLVVLFSGVKASPSFDQAVLTASSNTQDNSQNTDLYDQFNSYPGNSDSGNFNSSDSNFFGSVPNQNNSSSNFSQDPSQFGNSNSNFGNSFSQTPSLRPNTRSRRS